MSKHISVKIKGYLAFAVNQSNIAFGTMLYLGDRGGVKREIDRERREKFKSKTFNRGTSRFYRRRRRKRRVLFGLKRSKPMKSYFKLEGSASVRRTPKFYGRVYARSARYPLPLVGELIWSFVPHRNPWKEIYARACVNYQR